MNKFSTRFLVLLLIAWLSGLGCHSVSSRNTSSGNEIDFESTPTLAATPLQSNVQYLCANLSKLETIPYGYDELTGDPIYDGLKAAGLRAVPCLIEKITDTTPMKDPGPGPVFQDYKVGDAAVFLLLMITEEKWQPESMLSPEYSKHWETEGIYAYFEYVRDVENRRKMQDWWENWMKNNLKQ